LGALTEGLQTSCVHGGFFGIGAEAGGAQAEAVRVPLADGTLYPLPVGQDEALLPALLTLSDVMGTLGADFRAANRGAPPLLISHRKTVTWGSTAPRA
jgi:hypothetical protein